jgi:hypothetical protein
MHLNLAEKNPSRLLTSIQTAISQPRKSLSLELLGPGIMMPDTALMAYHALKARPDTLSIHAHSHTCLIDGAILPWLMADTRSMRPDAWIQVSDGEEILDGCSPGHGDYSTAVLAACESAATTDLRTIFHLLDEYLPVSEIAGLRLFESDLRDLGLIQHPDDPDPLIELFAAKPAAIKKTKRKTPNRKP